MRYRRLRCYRLPQPEFDFCDPISPRSRSLCRKCSERRPRLGHPTEIRKNDGAIDLFGRRASSRRRYSCKKAFKRVERVQAIHRRHGLFLEDAYNGRARIAVIELPPLNHWCAIAETPPGSTVNIIHDCRRLLVKTLCVCVWVQDPKIHCETVEALIHLKRHNIDKHPSSSIPNRLLCVEAEQPQSLVNRRDNASWNHRSWERLGIEAILSAPIGAKEITAHASLDS
jgi:hypothetical protein